MDETQNLVLQWAGLVLLAFLVVGSFTWFAAPVIEFPTCPVLQDLEVPEVNLTGIEGRLTGIEATLDEDDNWENEAESLAIEELEKRDYKDLFKWMTDEENVSIDDRDDIDRVVVKKTTFNDMNADDKDATVDLKLRVYYENSDGDDKKKTIYAQATIEDEEVEDLEFSYDEDFD